MVQEPLITTIIPTYRRPRLLSRAIKSVLAQSMERLRVCVCDNASGDETEEVVRSLEKVDPRISYHRQSRNVGATNNFNFGLQHVRTPYFSILSDDDLLLEDFYEKALRAFEWCPEAAFAATEVLYVNVRGEVVGTSNANWNEGAYFPPAGLLTMLCDGRHPPTWTGILFKAQILQDVGLLDGEVGGAIDYDFEQRVAARFPFVITPEVGALFMVHDESWGQTGRLDFVWPGWLKMIRNIADDTAVPVAARAEAGKLIRAELGRKVAHFGRQAIKRREPGEALVASEVLGEHFNAPFQSMSLHLLALCCRHVPGTYRVLEALNGLRRRMRRPVRPLLHSQGDLAELLRT